MNNLFNITYNNQTPQYIPPYYSIHTNNIGYGYSNFQVSTETFNNKCLLKEPHNLLGETKISRK